MLSLRKTIQMSVGVRRTRKGFGHVDAHEASRSPPRHHSRLDCPRPCPLCHPDLDRCLSLRRREAGEARSPRAFGARDDAGGELHQKGKSDPKGPCADEKEHARALYARKIMLNSVHNHSSRTQLKRKD